MSSRHQESTDNLSTNWPPSTVAGLLFVVVGGLSLLGISTAEMLPAAYTTTQAISDLGVLSASAVVFNGTMIVCGLLTAVTAYFLQQAIESKLLSGSLVLFGIGIAGVGLFPSDQLPWHYLFAMLTFITGGLTALLSARVVTTPFRYLCLFLGGLSLVMIVALLTLGFDHPLAFLEFGGIERWIVYPILLWATAFGGYLLGTPSGRTVSTGTVESK